MRGSLREKQPGVWQLRVYLGHGRQMAKHVRGTRREAERALAQLVADIEPDSTPAGTVSELLDEWAQHCARTGKHTPATVKNRAEVIGPWLKPAFGATPLWKLTARDLDRQYRRWLEEGHSPTAVRRRHEIMKAALNQATKWRMIPRNPALDASPPQPPPGRRHATSLDALTQTVRRLSEDHPDIAALILIAATTGARRGELLALRWGSVNLDVGTLTIRERISGRVLLSATKTGKSRTIALDPFTVTQFRAQRARAMERGMSVGTRIDDRSFVWSEDPAHQVPLDPASVTGRLGKLRRKTGLEIRMHELRHLAATVSIGAGADMKTVSGRLGHSKIAMTADGYADFVPVNDRAVAQVLGETIERALG